VPTEFTYKLMPELPAPPDWLLNQIDYNAQPEVNNIGAMGRRVLTDWDGYAGPATKNIRRAFVDEYDTWIRENITKDFQNCSLMYCRNYNDAPSTGAHTDYTRDYILMYNVQTGGPDAELVFWQEEGKPLIRERGCEIGTKANLKKIDGIVGPAGVWYLANGRILHSTEKVIDLRLNFQISFDTSTPWT